VRLTPRDTRFYGMFADAAAHLVTGAGLLSELLAAEPQERKPVSERMREAEHAADETTHLIMSTVNSTFITPFDREDIYTLASRLDDVMDAMEAAVDLIVLYAIEDLPQEFSDQVRVLTRAAELTSEAMPRLRSMRNLSDYWIEINRLENEADRTHRRFLARLFGGEYKAMTVMKLKDVAEALEDAADGFEKVANTIETIAVKES
jgi:predicted phosphate transport protein (TIGR00153 family)